MNPAPDIVIVGNVISRGNPALEYVMDEGMPYTSGPQWLAEHVLAGRYVLAVAGTHGKTTTASMLTWLLDASGLNPGFLIGGVPANFGVSARLGTPGGAFVVEADEYDTAFFDKRSKFVHYRPRTLILNNLEYDHADIFPDLASIERQFHHLVRTVPAHGRILVNGRDANLARVIGMGCWSEVELFGVDDGWHAREAEGGFEVCIGGRPQAICPLPQPGEHNRMNALAALAAAAHVGVLPVAGPRALASFRGVRRRLERVGEAGGITVYDDFAHHPTAVRATIEALAGDGDGRVLAVLEPRSNTMRLGGHAAELAAALEGADLAFVYARPDLEWDAEAALAPLGDRLRLHDDLDALVQDAAAQARAGDRLLVMSNGDFGGIQHRLLEALQAHA
jgi:UDP-N-acetylmuramate:L-alanyl-gamma-D-glutamyl-meso-diaminopimelate ligase